MATVATPPYAHVHGTGALHLCATRNPNRCCSTCATTCSIQRTISMQHTIIQATCNNIVSNTHHTTSPYSMKRATYHRAWYASMFATRALGARRPQHAEVLRVLFTAAACTVKSTQVPLPGRRLGGAVGPATPSLPRRHRCLHRVQVWLANSSGRVAKALLPSLRTNKAQWPPHAPLHLRQTLGRPAWPWCVSAAGLPSGGSRGLNLPQTVLQQPQTGARTHSLTAGMAHVSTCGSQ